MRNYIKKKNRLEKGNFVTLNSINIIVKDEILYDLEMKDLEGLMKSLPKKFLKNIDYVMFGKFDFLRKKNYNASYMDGVIYVDNVQHNNINILDDIVHEVGHSVEEAYYSLIYGDGSLESEFLQKRNMLKKEMDSSGYHIPDHLYSKSEYDEQLDMLFADKIGYPIMTSIVQGIYYSPYAATSLSEYFANGFEAYFYHKDLYLKKVSPILFSKIEQLEMEENYEV